MPFLVVAFDREEDRHGNFLALERDDFEHDESSKFLMIVVSIQCNSMQFFL